METVVVLTELEYEGRRYKPGQTMRLPHEAAQDFTDKGFVEVQPHRFGMRDKMVYRPGIHTGGNSR